jgi:hypothetical protein
MVDPFLKVVETTLPGFLRIKKYSSLWVTMLASEAGGQAKPHVISPHHHTPPSPHWSDGFMALLRLSASMFLVQHAHGFPKETLHNGCFH